MLKFKSGYLMWSWRSEIKKSVKEDKERNRYSEEITERESRQKRQVRVLYPVLRAGQPG